jgi:hypothetical protein
MTKMIYNTEQVRECYGRLQRTPQHLMALTEIQNMTDSDIDIKIKQKYVRKIFLQYIYICVCV